MIKVSVVLPPVKSLSGSLFYSKSDAATVDIASTDFSFVLQKKNTLIVLHVDAEEEQINRAISLRQPILLLMSKSFAELSNEKKKVFSYVICSGRCIAVWVYDDFEKSTEQYIDFMNKHGSSIEYRNVQGLFSFSSRVTFPVASKISIINVADEYKSSAKRVIDKIEEMFPDNSYSFEDFDDTSYQSLYDSGHILISARPIHNIEIVKAFMEYGSFIRFPKTKATSNVDSRITVHFSAVSILNREMPPSNSDIEIFNDFIKESISVYGSFSSIPLLGTRFSVDRKEELLHEIFHFIMSRELNA